MSTAQAIRPALTDGYFEIRLGCFVPGAPLACDVYLIVNNKPTLFRRRGEAFTADRLQSLATHGANKLLAPNEQREMYLASMRKHMNDAGIAVDVKGKLIKETAFVHLQELFTNPNVHEVVKGTETLVTDMVQFLSGSSAAAASLLKLSAHNNYAFNHSVNVSVYAIMLVKKLNGLDPSQLVVAGLSALLHDIGKRELPAALNLKTLPLTKEELQMMKLHPVFGEKALMGVHVTQQVKEVVAQHHENFDGSGYPRGLKGEQISQMARIVAIADAFDALTTERPGQKAFLPDEALELMASLQPHRFDPTIFQHFGRKGATSKLTVKLGKDFDPCSPQPIPLVSKDKT